MVKRVLIVAAVLAAIFVLAAPALAFDGFRDTYVNTPVCAGCHGGDAVYTDWSATSHAMVGEATVTEIAPGEWELAGTANAEPIADGPGCAGCHSGNYDTEKAIPDATTGFYPWVNTAGDDAFSEPFVGCSTCHWGQGASGELGMPGITHTVPMGNMANADICGQCHSRYSLSTVQYPNSDGTSAFRQYTRGDFNPLGVGTTDPAWSPSPISDFLNIATPATPQSMVYYKLGDELLPWNARGHEEGAAQYPEWAAEGHANALNAIKGYAAFMDITECLECHSSDYRLLEEAGDDPTVADVKYGVTCITCHAPHKQGAQTSFWNEERNPQLTATRQTLCVECHNAELAPQADGSPGIAAPGSAVHHPMKEMMAGTGAIDVPQGSPSVHKGRCVQCHMVPTSYDRNGVPMTGSNHAFAIVEPEVAAEAVSTAAIGGEIRHMPASSCSSCHKQDGTQYATYLQETLDDRQEAMKNWDAQVTVALEAGAKALGFKDSVDDEGVVIPNSAIDNANATLNDKQAAGASWNDSQLNFQKAFTNQQYIESEGSWGIHNWDYARTVILKALDQAKAVTPGTVVTIKTSASSIKVNAKVTISGVVNTATTGKVTIQRKKGSGSWSTWKSPSLTSYGKYSSGAVKMTSKGTFYFRTKFAATDTQVGGTSAQVKVVVK